MQACCVSKYTQYLSARGWIGQAYAINNGFLGELFALVFKSVSAMQNHY